MPEKNADLSNIEVNHVIGLMSDVRAETFADNAVPAGSVHDIEFSFDEFSDVFFYSEFFEGSSSAVDGMLSHP